MRLIDLDAVIEVQMYDEEHDEWSLKKMTVEDYLCYASEMPPIVEERKKGRWIRCVSTTEGQIAWYDYKCSCCSHHRDRRMNFCEVCGADMRGEKDGCDK